MQSACTQWPVWRLQVRSLESACFWSFKQIREHGSNAFQRFASSNLVSHSKLYMVEAAPGDGLPPDASQAVGRQLEPRLPAHTSNDRAAALQHRYVSMLTYR